MDTLLMIVFYPAVAMWVYIILVIRGMYVKQARNDQAGLNFFQWVATTARMRSRRRYLIYMIVLLITIIIILTILAVHPFNR